MINIMPNRFPINVVAFSAALLLASCKDDQEAQLPDQPYDDGVLVINGGNFFQNNGTISYLQRNSNIVQENIFNVANGTASLPPADGRIEGYAEASETGVIIFDNDTPGADKLVFVDASTFKKKSELSAPSVENPRAIVMINERKAYVTNWDVLNEDWTYKDGFITIIDPENGEESGKFHVGQGPEEMVIYQNRVFVGRAPWTSHELAVIDTNTDQVIASIPFNSWPNPIGVDVNGKLWVKERNNLHKINPTSLEVEQTVQVGNDSNKSIGAATLTADKNHLFVVLSYSNEETNWEEVGDTYLFNIAETQINIENPVLRRVFTGLAADPISQQIYGGITPSLTQAGYVLRLSPTGELLDSVKVEISPEGFYFK